MPLISWYIFVTFWRIRDSLSTSRSRYTTPLASAETTYFVFVELKVTYFCNELLTNIGASPHLTRARLWLLFLEPFSLTMLKPSWTVICMNSPGSIFRWALWFQSYIIALLLPLQNAGLLDIWHEIPKNALAWIWLVWFWMQGISYLLPQFCILTIINRLDNLPYPLHRSFNFSDFLSAYYCSIWGWNEALQYDLLVVTHHRLVAFS